MLQIMQDRLYPRLANDVKLSEPLISALCVLETVEHANAAWPRPLRKASGFPALSRNVRGYSAAEAEPQTLMLPPRKPEAFRNDNGKAASNPVKFHPVVCLSSDKQGCSAFDSGRYGNNAEARRTLRRTAHFLVSNSDFFRPTTIFGL